MDKKEIKEELEEIYRDLMGAFSNLNNQKPYDFGWLMGMAMNKLGNLMKNMKVESEEEEECECEDCCCVKCHGLWKEGRKG